MPVGIVLVVVGGGEDRIRAGERLEARVFGEVEPCAGATSGGVSCQFKDFFNETHDVLSLNKKVCVNWRSVRTIGKA